MVVQAGFSYGGIAAGVLAPGNYTTSLSYLGWTNDISIAIYAVSGGTASYAFNSTFETNPDPVVDIPSLSISLPLGGSTYLGVAGTGGYALNSSSFTTVSEEAPAWEMAGVTQEIGNQSGNVLSTSTGAEGAGIAGVGIYSGPTGPTPVVLASLSTIVGDLNASFPVSFTVPADVSEVIYAWAIGGGLAVYQAPTLPAGLTVAASVGPAGLAMGSLSPGTYSTELAYLAGGWTNDVSIVVLGIEDGANTSYRVGSATSQNPNAVNSTSNASVELPAGAAFYLGVGTTGGYALSSYSMTDLLASAPAWEMAGTTEVIGIQTGATVSDSSAAYEMGVLGLGLYTTLTNVTFEASGLPTGAAWSVTVDGVRSTTTGTSLTVPELPGTLASLITGPTTYRVVGPAPSGTFTVSGTSAVEMITFHKGKTASLEVRETGLPLYSPWCFTLSGSQDCTTGASLSLSNLTPSSYSYTISTWSGVPVTAKLGHTTLASSGTVALSGKPSIVLTFGYPYAVSFVETGLSAGTWTVTVGGVTESAAAGNTIVFHLPDGTYSYKVTKVPGYLIFKLPPKVKVLEQAASAQVYFVPKS